MEALPTVLLVEDDDGHALLVQKALRKAGFQNDVRRFWDGQDVLDFLFNVQDGQAGELSMVMLLDIKMPMIHGTEVLRQVKSSAQFKGMAVIMVTTTDDPHEVERCQQLGCDSYLVKPLEWKDFTDSLRSISRFLAPGANGNSQISLDAPQ